MPVFRRDDAKKLEQTARLKSRIPLQALALDVKGL
jgi:hypothetical protein